MHKFAQPNQRFGRSRNAAVKNDLISFAAAAAKLCEAITQLPLRFDRTNLKTKQ
jgi:hypothetical protein